jgi:hypothetical protein
MSTARSSCPLLVGLIMVACATVVLGNAFASTQPMIAATDPRIRWIGRVNVIETPLPVVAFDWASSGFQIIVTNTTSYVDRWAEQPPTQPTNQPTSKAKAMAHLLKHKGSCWIDRCVLCRVSMVLADCCNDYNVFINGVRSSVVNTTDGSEERYAIAQSLNAAATYLIEVANHCYHARSVILDRADWGTALYRLNDGWDGNVFVAQVYKRTEAQQNANQAMLIGLEVDNESSLKPIHFGLPSRKLGTWCIVGTTHIGPNLLINHGWTSEFLGDSITCGYGNLANSTCPGNPQWQFEDNSLTWGAFLAQRFDGIQPTNQPTRPTNKTNQQDQPTRPTNQRR